MIAAVALGTVFLQTRTITTSFVSESRLALAESSVQSLLDTSITPEMFPANWHSAPINGHATHLSNKEAKRSKSAVSDALKKYKPGFLVKNLNRIHLVESLEFYNLSYGGTCTQDRVYIANKGELLGYTDSFLAGTFHHEFSSVLLTNHLSDFNQSAWKKANPKKFDYVGTGVDALKNGSSSLEYSDSWHVQGFLAEYGTASLEEDFNLFAEGLFSGKSEFWSAYERFEPVRTKANLVIEFYHKLDESFTKEKFQSFRP